MGEREEKKDGINKYEKEKRIKKEVSKIRKNYKDCDKKILDFATPLIENAAFMTVTLEYLMDEINKDGCTVEYKNGENQYGTKKNPAVESYNTMQKNHAALMRQLSDLIPTPEALEMLNKEKDDDGFDEFIGARPR